MSDPGAITTLNYRAQAREIFDWFFSMYFNGESHEVNGESVVFPDCDIVFENEQLPLSLPKPRIRIRIEGGGSSSMRLRSGNSRNVVTDVDVSFWVIVPKARGAQLAGARTRDRVQGLIESLLVCFGFVLGTRGLRPHSVSDDVVVEESPHYAISTRSAAFYVTRLYAHSDPIER